jgi:signal transduction histidine kinase
MISKTPARKNTPGNKTPVSLVLNAKMHSFHPPSTGKESTDQLALLTELSQTKADLQDYIRGFQQIMFQATHKIRQPIANLQGLSSLLEKTSYSKTELKIIAGYIRQSISVLDVFTKDLILFISNLANSKKK